MESSIEFGKKYSKSELSEMLKEPSLKLIREGIYHCKNANDTLLFVDLEKEGKEDRFHFDDFYEEDFFHWDSQTTQHIESPKIKEIIEGKRVTHLFARLKQKEKGKTQPFIYCGKLEYVEYEPGTSKPVHIIFKNVDYDDFTANQDLIEIYSWRPGKIGKTSKSKISKKGVISKERKVQYKKPNTTERTGLVTSRVGQGYYRQQLIEKWNGTCPVTKCNLTSILIASHIVSWSQSTDDEKLDVDNGILLSPNLDALFDKHLISFDDEGKILLSESISQANIEKLGISKNRKIHVNEKTKEYLRRHREIFLT